MNFAKLIGQKSYEKILYVLRRDPITFVPRVLLFVVLLVLPGILYALITVQFPTLIASKSVYAAVVIFGSMYALSIVLFFYTAFIDFYLDISIVTNDRIIDIEQSGLFSKRTAEFDLFHIQDAAADVRGFFGSVFDYGTVTVKTASTTDDLIFSNVPNPNFIREELIRLSHEDRKYHNDQLPTINHKL